MWDKLWATWWAICCGYGMVTTLYRDADQQWTGWFGTSIYFLLFLATLYQIHAKQSVFMWYMKYRKRRKEWRDDPNSWSV